MTPIPSERDRSWHVQQGERALERWKREVRQDVLEERTAAANAAYGVPASDDRPQWMRDHDHGGGEMVLLT